jgi:CubicO group peptidase (beta-lactamase class C family)
MRSMVCAALARGAVRKRITGRRAMQRRVFTLAVLAALAVAAPSVPCALAQTSAREIAGLSQERLAKLVTVFRSDVDEGRIPGVVVLVARNGEVALFEAIGFRDRAAAAKMEKDAIFRLYSMTKPIVSVAAMMLVEEGRMLLMDPVSKHMPELKGLKVGVEKPGPEGKPVLELVPSAREMTVQDLLRHTSGITYGIFGRSLVKAAYNELNPLDGKQTSGEMVAKFAKLPLAFQPGTTWDYGQSTDLLGVLVERVSGKPLDMFLDERILKPLGMKDAGFFVPAPNQGRIAEAQPEGGKPQNLLAVKERPSFLAGGHGMVSTAADYLRFTTMLLNGGELDGVRLLSRKTVEYMTSDHLGTLSRGPAYSPGPGYGFGLGFAVRTNAGMAAMPGTVGDYYWGGLGGTYFWVDPKEKLIAILMLQAPSQRDYYRALFRDLVYAAMVK